MNVDIDEKEAAMDDDDLIRMMAINEYKDVDIGEHESEDQGLMASSYFIKA